MTYINPSQERFRIVSDEQLVLEERREGQLRVAEAIKLVESAKPRHLKLVKGFSGAAQDGLFRNESYRWMPARRQENATDTEKTVALHDGDELGGLKHTNIAEIVQKTDKMAEETEVQKLDDAYTALLPQYHAEPQGSPQIADAQVKVLDAYRKQTVDPYEKLQQEIDRAA